MSTSRFTSAGHGLPPANDGTLVWRRSLSLRAMCGIAGYVSVGEDADGTVVQSMCDEIRHRGPDDFGVYTDGPCAIGMRRLSIIDLSTGHQPLANEDESVWIVFNGEIYNFQELRPWLENRGHRFRTNSDTEAIVHLYEEEGTDGIARLRGMFAFAIWDRRRRRLLLARDRFGKKPLYYAALPGGLWFGSELKCLEAAGVPLEADRDAIQLYFQFSYIPDPYSVYRDIRKLPAGSWMTFDAGGHVEQGRYWRWPHPAVTEPEGLTEQMAAGQIRELFDESVRIRMIADVPLGAFLSGGVDSGSVVASMALQSRDPIKTFSIGFEEPGFNELEAAEMVAREYHTEHHAIVVHPDSVALVERLVRHFDEPFGDASALPTFILSEFAVQHVKVALSGDGGDEVFAGYWSFFQVERLRQMGAIPDVARRCDRRSCRHAAILDLRQELPALAQPAVRSRSIFRRNLRAAGPPEAAGATRMASPRRRRLHSPNAPELSARG